MNVKTGVFLGSASAMYLGFGFVPDKLTLRSNAAGLARFTWTRNGSKVAASAGGTSSPGDGNTDVALTMLTGFRPYLGGAILDTESALYLVPLTERPDLDKNWAGSATLFTMDTQANGTGHFDATPDTTYVGVGSKVVIGKKTNIEDTWQGFVTAQSTNWTGTDNVTLSPDAPASGYVKFMGHMYDLVNCPVGVPMMQGVYVCASCLGAVVYEFEAVQY